MKKAPYFNVQNSMSIIDETSGNLACAFGREVVFVLCTQYRVFRHPFGGEAGGQGVRAYLCKRL